MARNRRSWEAVDRSSNPEEILILKEEAEAAEAAAAPYRRMAAAFKAECIQLTPAEQGCIAAFLMDDRVRRPWAPMTAREVGDLFTHTATWARVRKLLARRGHPCGGGPSACGRDVSACAHERGRKTFYEAFIRSLNRPESK